MKEEEVVKYLIQHPNFFHEHLELLEMLHVPHPHHADNVVSLIETQVCLLRASTNEYKSQFKSLVQVARDSDLIVQRSKKIVSASMHCTNLDDFSILLDDVIRNDFLIDHHAVLLFSDNPLDTNIPTCTFSKGIDLFSERISNRNKCYDELSYKQVRELFPYDDVKDTKSFATFPLFYQHQGKEYSLGLFALASDTEHYFEHNKSVLSLDYFSELFSSILIRLML